MAGTVWELILQEHQLVRDLMSKVAASDGEQRISLLDELRTKVVNHASLEETLIYPLLEEMDKDLADRAEEETEEIEEQLVALSKLDAANAEFAEAMQDALQVTLAHIEDEEQRIIPLMQREIGDERSTKLGQEWVRTKQEIASEPEA